MIAGKAKLLIQLLDLRQGYWLSWCHTTWVLEVMCHQMTSLRKTHIPRPVDVRALVLYVDGFFHLSSKNMFWFNDWYIVREDLMPYFFCLDLCSFTHIWHKLLKMQMWMKINALYWASHRIGLFQHCGHQSVPHGEG